MSSSLLLIEFLRFSAVEVTLLRASWPVFAVSRSSVLEVEEVRASSPMPEGGVLDVAPGLLGVPLDLVCGPGVGEVLIADCFAD